MIARALLMIFAIVFCFKAEAKDGRGIVYGSGMQSCGAWTYKTDSDVGEQTSWVMGYISAFNVYQGEMNVGAGTDLNGIFGWIDNYCAAHPLDPIIKATDALVDELSGRAGQQDR
jgi:hypothetical protein